MESDDWKEMRKEQQARRAARHPVRKAEIEGLAEKGFTVKPLTEFQFRVNDVLDLYPIHNRFHDLKKNRRGGYRNATEFVEKFFRF